MRITVVLLAAFAVSAANCLAENYWKNNACDTYLDYLTLKINPKCVYNPDVGSDVYSMIERHGYTPRSYKVTTVDGYELEVFRVLPKNGPETGRTPVFLQHGLQMDASIWVLVGERSLAFRLADMGYDVWLGNYRGSPYGLKHKTLSPNEHKFWDFSFHEMGIYDLPAMIGLVSEKTNKTGEIIYIGHSMGTTGVFIYSTEKKQHAHENLRGIIGLAPVAFLDSAPIFNTIKPFINLLLQLFVKILETFGAFETGDTTGNLQNIAERFCTLGPVTSMACSTFAMLWVGFDLSQLMPRDIPLLVRHCMDPNPAKVGLHYMSFASSGKFQQYDYGLLENLEIYKSPNPPEYDLKSIKMPVHLFYGRSDVLADEKDSERLYDVLTTKEKSITGLAENGKVKFNHIDFIFAKDIYYLHDPLFEVVKHLSA